MTVTLAQLEEELGAIDVLVEEAAVQEDPEMFVHLSMRRAALPALIRQERAAPLRAQLERLNEELEALDEEMERARTEDPPEVPAGMAGTITRGMMRNRRLGGIVSRQGRSAKERKHVMRQIEAVERVGVQPLA